MLPPVSAISAVDFTFHPSSTRLEGTPAVALVAAPVLMEQEDATAGASAMARAVSGELRLSQNTGVLAETLGKLLSIARMDGEPSDTYIERLVTAMQSLPAEARATLEKQLGSILRGISLSMLADALKNSAGPEAARLAVMFELARSTGSPRGTRSPVSTYLQDLVPQNLGALPQPVRGVPPAPATPANPLVEAAKTALLLIAKEGQLPHPVAPTQGYDAALPKPASGNAPAMTISAAGGATLPTHTSPPAQTSLPAQASPQAAVSAGLSAAPVPAPPVAPSVASSAPTPAPTASVGTATAPLPTPSPLPSLAGTVRMEKSIAIAESPDNEAVTEKHPMGLPQPEAGKAAPASANPFAAATAKDMEGLLLATLLRPLPAQAQPLEQVPMQTLPAMPELEQAEKSHMPPPASASVPGAPDTDDEANALPRADAAIASHRAVSAQELDAAILTQPALNSAVAMLIAKEGIPLPFVNYPAADDEQEGDAPPRGRWPSSEGSAGEEESGEGQPHENGEQEERTAANDEVIDHSLSDGANDDGSLASAQSYYLKMSGAS